MTLDHSEMSTSEPLLFAWSRLESHRGLFFRVRRCRTTPFHDPRPSAISISMKRKRASAITRREECTRVYAGDKKPRVEEDALETSFTQRAMCLLFINLIINAFILEI